MYRGTSTVMLKPKSTQEVSEILTYCSSRRLVLCVRIIIARVSIANVKHLVSAKFLLVAALGLIPFDLNQFLRNKKVLAKMSR